MIRYEFFDEGKLLITKYIGDISQDSIKNYIQFILSDSNCANLEKLLTDYRDAVISFSPKAVKEIAQVRKAWEAGHKKNRTVFLVDKPRETALILMISNIFNEELDSADFCSTLNGCVRSLLLDIHIDELDKRINELNFEFVESAV